VEIAKLRIFWEIRHYIPGRVRFYVPAVQTERFARNLSALIGKESGVTTVRTNQSCGALIIDYDQSRPELFGRLKSRLETLTIEDLSAEMIGDAQETERNQATEDGGGGWFAWLEAHGWPALALTTSTLALSVFEAPLAVPITIGLSIYNALPIVRRAFTTVVQERRLNVDVLDTLAIGISTWQGRLFTTTFMIWLITLGDWIRDQTAARSKKAIGSLLDFQQRNAWILRGGEKVEVPVKEIAVGDTVVVYSGEMIPVDGEVISGSASVDQRSISGESMPVLRESGDRVYATSLMHEGKLYIKATHRAVDSLAAQIVRMVEAAPVGETRIQNYAEKFADRLVLPTLGLAGGLYALTSNLDRTLSALIVDFGTGIRVAAPTAVLASMVGAAQRGVLIRGGRHMENLSRVDAVVFDKTGTLTEGAPRIVDIISYKKRSFSPHEVLRIAAAVETRFKHPVAIATLAKAHEYQIDIPERSDSKYSVGMGVEASVNGYYVHLGSERFLRESGISIACASTNCRDAARSGRSSLMLAVNGELVGQLVYQDQLRAESAVVVRELRERKIRSLVMLTGDNLAAGRTVANQLGLDQFHAEILPQEKAEVVGELQSRGKVVAMVGDGVNDAPALSRANVGIAMRNGVDIARHTADVVLIQDDLSGVVTAIDISREAIALVNQNYSIVAGLNMLALAAAVTGGMIGPELTALISNGSALVASANGLRPLLPVEQQRHYSTN